MNVLYPENSYGQPVAPPNFAAIFESIRRYQSPVPLDRQSVLGVDMSKYPYPYVIGSNNEELRAETQSRWDQWGNAAARTGSQLVLGTMKGIADIPDLFRAFLGPDGLAALADEEFSNDFSEALGQLMEGVKEATPIYLEQDERGFVPWKAAWWATNMESIATGVSMLLPTIGAAKTAGVVARSLGKIAQGTKAANLVMGKNGTAITGSIVGALYGNAYESMQEMQELLPQLKQQMEDAGMATDEINKKLKEEANRIYWTNLPNAALDMLGIYTLTKPFGDEIVQTAMKKRLKKTALTEVIPEGVQELVNHYASQRAQASVDKTTGIRSEDYSLAEFLKDPQTWTSGFFGALGGAAFAGGANAINQISENISTAKEAKLPWHKGLFSNFGDAAVSGLTTKERKLAAEQETILNNFAIRKQKLSELKNISELAGNKELYDDIQNSLAMEEAVTHLAMGTFDRFMKHLGDVSTQLDALEKDEAFKDNPDLVNEFKSQREALKKTADTLQTAQKHYSKGVRYYGLSGERLIKYALASSYYDYEKAKLDRLIAERDAIFAEDEYGILRTTESPEITKLKEQLDEMETAFNKSAPGYENKIREEIDRLSKEIERLEGSTKSVNDELELSIAQQHLIVKTHEAAAMDAVKNAKTTKADVYDSLYNEEKLKDLIYKAYNSKLSKSDLTLDTIGKALTDDKIPINEQNRDAILKVLNDAKDEVSVSFTERVDELIRTREGVEPKDLTDEELAELEEKYRAEVESGIAREIAEINKLKGLAISKTNFNPKIRSAEEVIHEYLEEELDLAEAALINILDDESNTDFRSVMKTLAHLSYLEAEASNTKYTVSSEDKARIKTLQAMSKDASDAISRRLQVQSDDQLAVLNTFIGTVVESINMVTPFPHSSPVVELIDNVLKTLRADTKIAKSIDEAIKANAAKFRQAAFDMGTAIVPKSMTLFAMSDSFTQVAAETTPEQLLYSTISMIYASEGAPSQRAYELSLNHKTIVRDKYNEQLVETYDNLIPYVNLKRLLESSKTLKETVAAIKDVANETKEYPFPDQLTSLIDLVQWYSGKSIDVAFLQGIAGSGKTNLISKHLPLILNKLFKLEKDSILPMSNTPNTDRLIRKSVLGTDEIKEVISNNPTKLKEALSKAKFVIIDEIGKFGFDEVQLIYDALYGAEGVITKGHSVKVLITGDPNQFIHEGSLVPTIPAINGWVAFKFAARVQFISPLNYSIRSNNTELTEFQNKFLKAGKSNVYTSGTTFTQSYDPDNLNGVRISASREALKAVATEKLRRKENFAIIVQDEGQKAGYAQVETDGIKRVFTFKEAQGSEWDSILVDVQIYKKHFAFGYTTANRGLYTAFSRARNYIFWLTAEAPENKPIEETATDAQIANIVNMSDTVLLNNTKNAIELLDQMLGLEEAKPEAKPATTPSTSTQQAPDEPEKPANESPITEQEVAKEQQEIVKDSSEDPAAEEEVDAINDKEVKDTTTPSPIPGLKIKSNKDRDNLVKNSTFKKSIADIPIEKSGSKDVKFVTVVSDGEGNIYFVGKEENIPPQLQTLIDLTAVTKEAVKVIHSRSTSKKTVQHRDGTISVQNTRRVLSFIPTSIVRESKWKKEKVEDEKPKPKKDKGFTPLSWEEVVIHHFAVTDARMSFKYASGELKGKELEKAIKNGMVATKKEDSMLPSEKAAANIYDNLDQLVEAIKPAIAGLVGEDNADSFSYDQADLPVLVDSIIFGGQSRRALKEDLQRLQEDRDFANDPDGGMGMFNTLEEKLAYEAEQERLKKAYKEAIEEERIAKETSFQTFTKEQRELYDFIKEIAREYYNTEENTFDRESFIKDPRLQEVLEFLPTNILEAIQSLDNTSFELIKVHPRYDAIVKLKRDGLGNIINDQVLIAYREANPGEPRKDKVIHKVYLIRDEEGDYTEVGITTIPDDGRARLRYATSFTNSSIQDYIDDGGYLGKGVITDFGKRQFIYDYNDPLPITELQNVIERVFIKSPAVVNRRIQSVQPLQYFAGTKASISLINQKLLHNNSPLKLVFDTAANRKNVKGDGHEYIVKGGNPYVLIAINTTDISGNNPKVEYKVVELSGSKINKNSSANYKVLEAFMNNVSEVETILGEFDFKHKYGSSSNQVEIGDELYQEAALFKQALNFRVEEDKIVSESSFDEVNKLHDAINAHPESTAIINKLLNLKNQLYKYEEKDGEVKGSVDFDRYSVHANAFVKLDKTNVSLVDNKTVSAMLDEPTLMPFFVERGFKFVMSSDSQRVLEARRTLEVVGTNANGVENVFHVLITVPFERKSVKNPSWILNEKAPFRIEIFKLNREEYEDFDKSPKNVDKKSAALNRIRKGYIAPDGTSMPNVVFDSIKSNIPIPVGITILEKANYEEAIRNVITQALNKGKTRREPVTPIQDALNAIAKVNAKIWLDDNSYVSIRKEKIETAGLKDDEGETKYIRVMGPSALGSEELFEIHRRQPDGSFTLSESTVQTEDGEVLEVVDALDLRDLLGLVLDPSRYDEEGNSTHNKEYTSVKGDKATVGLREAVKDRGMKALTAVDIEGNFTEEQDVLAEETRAVLSVALKSYTETFVDISEEKGPTAVVPVPKQESPKEIDPLTQILNDYEEESFDDDDVMTFSLDEASVTASNMITEEEAIAYVKRYIPDFDSNAELRTHVNNVMIGMRKYGEEVLGAYSEGIIHLLKGTSSNFELEVLRHELFHKLFDTYLPTEVKKSLMRHTKALSGSNLSEIEIEEALARRFQNFVISGKESDNILSRFFNWFLKLLKGLFSAATRHEEAIKKIFTQIEKGKYSTKLAAASPGVKFMKEVYSLFPGRTAAESQQSALNAITYLKYRLVGKNIYTSTEGSARDNHMFNGDSKDELVTVMYEDMVNTFIVKMRQHLAALPEPITDIALQNALITGQLRPHTKLSAEEQKNKSTLKEEYLKTLDYIKSFNDEELTTLYTLVVARRGATKGNVYKAVLEDIMPDRDFSAIELSKLFKSIVEEMREPDEDGTQLSRPNFHEEYMQNATINQEVRISKELKILMAFIERPALRDFIPAKYAYAKTIQLLMYLNDTKEMASKLSMAAFDKSSNVGKVAQHLLDVIYTAQSDFFSHQNITYKESNFPIMKAVTFRNNKFQVYGRDIPVPTSVNAELGLTAAYEDAVIAILQEESQASEDILRAMLKFIKRRDFSRDLVAKIYHELGSQVEIHPIVDQSAITFEGWDEFDFAEAASEMRTPGGDLHISTFSISAAGVRQNIIASIRTSIQDLIVSKSKQEIIELKQKADKKLVSIETILKTLGVTSFVGKKFSSVEINSIKTYFSAILNQLVLNYDEARSNPTEQRLYLEESQLKDFAEIFTANADFLSTLSYKGADGNTRYTYVVGSWIYDVLGALAEKRYNEFIKGVYDEKNKKFIKGYIAENNFFMNNVSFVLNTADFDKMKQKNSDFDAIAYKNFNPGQFLAHRFIYGYVGHLTKGRNKEARPKYLQYSFIQSNRNADTGIETYIFTRKEMEKAFNMAKAMEEARPDIKDIKNFDKDKARFMQYDSFNEFRRAMITKAIDSFPEFLENMKLVPGMDFSGKGKKVVNLNKALDRVSNEDKKFLESYGSIMSKKEVEAFKSLAEKKFNNILPEKNAALLPLWINFFMQNYIGSFHLTTAVFGDVAFAKDTNDLVKRMQGVNSPGRKQLVGEGYNKPVSKIAVTKDAVFKVSEFNDIKKLFSKIYGSKIESTDAYTIGIPLTLRGIHNGTGDYALKDIVKIVSFYIDPKTNRTTYLKTALFIVTDELARMFPGLREIRREMETHGMSEEQKKKHAFYFRKMLSRSITPKESAEYEALIENAIEYYAPASAFKIGRPVDNNLPSYGEIKVEAILPIYNRYVRIQSNPAHDEDTVADPSQFNYFINVNNRNEVEAFNVYSKITEILKLKQSLLKFQDKLVKEFDPEGKLIIEGNALRLSLMKSLKNTPGGDDKLYNLLAEGVSVNYPPFVNKAIINLMNTLSRSSVEVRHTGNKLVAQSAVGVRLFEVDGKVIAYDKLSSENKIKADLLQAMPQDVIDTAIGIQDILTSDDSNPKKFLRENLEDIKSLYGLKDKALLAKIFDETSLSFKDNVLVPRRLKMRDQNGYTEVVAPKWWLDKLGYKIGDKSFVLTDEYKDLLNTGMAVRIPTTGIHSAVAIKIVATTEEGFNRIIAPEELVALHGSDFDIDALFSIRRETFDDYIVTKPLLESIERFKQLSEEDKAKLVEDVRSSFLKYTSGELVGYNFDGTYDKELRQNVDRFLTMELPDKLKAFVINLKMKILMNEKLDIEASIITAPKNREDMNTPISFELIKDDIFEKQGLDPKKITEEERKEILLSPDRGVVSKLKAATRSSDIQGKRDPFNIMDQMRYHKDNFEGATGTGIQANMSKASAYIQYATPIILETPQGELEFRAKDIRSMSYTNEEQTEIEIVTGEGTFTGKYRRDKVKIPKSFNILWNGQPVVFDAFEVYSKIHGHRTTELADTVLNGYLDNVKEQITWIMNATPVSIEPIAYMIAIGMDLDLIAFMLRQGPLMQLMKSKFSKEKRLKAEISRLTSLVKQLPEFESVRKENIEDELKKQGLSYESLVEGVERESGTVPYSTLIVKLENGNTRDLTQNGKYLKTQLLNLIYIRDIMEGGAVIGDTARGLDVLRQFKITPEDIYKKRNDIKQLHSSVGKFGVDLRDVPHIGNAFNSFDKAVEAMKGIFPAYNDVVEGSLANVVKMLGLETTSNSYMLSATNYAFIHDQFQQIISAMVAARFKNELIKNSKFFLPSSNAINTATGEFIHGVPTSQEIEEGAVDILNPERAHIQYFLTNLRALKNSMPDNLFLASLNIEIGPGGLLRIDFHRGTTNNPVFDALVETHFSELDEDIKNGLIYYDLYYNRAKFSFRSYSTFMGPEVTSRLSSMYTSELNRAVELFKASERFQHYISYLMLKNAEVANYSAASNAFSREARYPGEKAVFNKYFIEPNQEPFYKVIGRREGRGNVMPYTFASDGKYIYMLVAAYKESTDFLTYTISDGILSLEDLKRNGKEKEEGADAFLFKRIDRISKWSTYDYNFDEELNWLDGLSDRPEFMAISKNEMKELLEAGQFTREYSYPLYYKKKGELKEKNSKEISPVRIKVTSGNLDSAVSVLYTKTVEKVVDEQELEKSQVKYVETFKKISDDLDAEFQRSSTGPKVAKEAIKKISNILSERFRIGVDFVDNPNLKWAGMYKGGRVTINLAFASLDTPYHEFAHPFISVVKKVNPALYNNLMEEVENTEIYTRIMEERTDLSYTARKEEALVEALGLYASKNYDPETNTSFWGHIEELFNMLVEFLRDLLKSPLINPASINPSITLKELAMVLGNLNVENKIDLVGEQEKIKAFDELVRSGLIRYTCKI